MTLIFCEMFRKFRCALLKRSSSRRGPALGGTGVWCEKLAAAHKAPILISLYDVVEVVPSLSGASNKAFSGGVAGGMVGRLL